MSRCLALVAFATATCLASAAPTAEPARERATSTDLKAVQPSSAAKKKAKPKPVIRRAEDAPRLPHAPDDRVHGRRPEAAQVGPNLKVEFVPGSFQGGAVQIRVWNAGFADAAAHTGRVTWNHIEQLGSWQHVYSVKPLKAGTEDLTPAKMHSSQVFTIQIVEADAWPFVNEIRVHEDWHDHVAETNEADNEILVEVHPKVDDYYAP